MDAQNLRWWGWGTLDQGYALEGRPALWPALQEWLELDNEALERETPPVPLGEISVRPSRLDDPVLTSLRKLLGEEVVCTGDEVRIAHAYGKSYCDLIRIRAGHVPDPPDAVVYPPEPCKVAALLGWAADRDIAVIPYGGGSGVLGGVEPAPGDRLVITLDMAKLDRVFSVDDVSRTARIQAGATGPEIEAQLNARGFTLGHFPQSFEYSTLGGWLATRSAGQNSIGYGKIEDMTQSLRAVTPVGVIETKDTPATAAGPSLLQLLVGSEGAYGVITEATMRIRPRPQVQDYRGVLFHSLEDGATAYRELMQSADLHPSIVRLCDPSESCAHVALSRSQQGLHRLADGLLGRYLQVQGYDWPNGNGLLMLLGFDGEAGWVGRQWTRALDVCGDYHGVSMGRAVGRSWMRDRFSRPYLRDVLLGHGILVDTIETATTWSGLLGLYAAMVKAIRGTISATGGGPGFVMVHISHAYEQGASLCATFLGRQVEDPNPLAKQAQRQEVKRAATDAIIAAGGTLTHHHGIGREHAPWLRDEMGPLGVESLRALKETFDPSGILNPGVLLP